MSNDLWFLGIRNLVFDIYCLLVDIYEDVGCGMWGGVEGVT